MQNLIIFIMKILFYINLSLKNYCKLTFSFIVELFIVKSDMFWIQ